MRLAWLTDIHLNFLDPPGVAAFLRTVAEVPADAVLLSGDVGESDDVARHLERIWGDRVSYPFWEAHAFHVENGHVEFEAATRHSSAGHYVTVHLVAQKASIPAQRPGGSA